MTTNKLMLPSHDESLELISAAKLDPKKLDELTKKYLILVKLAAKKWLKNSRGADDFDDLYQEGSLGLLSAFRNFDPAQGVLFTTYAFKMIDGYIRWSLTDAHIRRKYFTLYGDCEFNSVNLEVPADFINFDESVSGLAGNLKFEDILDKREMELIQYQYQLTLD